MDETFLRAAQAVKSDISKKKSEEEIGKLENLAGSMPNLPAIGSAIGEALFGGQEDGAQADPDASFAEGAGLVRNPTTGEWDFPEEAPEDSGARSENAIGGSVLTGAAKAGFELNDLAHEIQGDPTKPEERSAFRQDIEAMSGEFAETTPVAPVVEDVSRFVTGMIGVGKLLQPIKAVQKLKEGGKVAKTAYEIGRGAITGGIVLDPHEERLSDLVQSYPALENPISEYLAADPNDSHMEGRLKNALEGIGMDLALVGVFEGALKAVRFARRGDQEAAKAAIAELDTPQTVETIAQAEKPRVRVKAGSQKVEAGGEAAAAPPPAQESATVPVRSEASDLPAKETVGKITLPDVSAPDLAQVLRGTDFDLTAIEAAGSYNEAALRGHKFTTEANLPWQTLNTPEDVKVMIDNMVPAYKTELDAMKGGDVLHDAKADRQIRAIASYYNEDPAAIFGELAKAGEAAKNMVKLQGVGYLIANKMSLDAFEVIRKIRSGNLDDFGGDKVAAIAEAKRRFGLFIQSLGQTQSIRANAGRSMRRLRGEFKITDQQLSKIMGMEDEKFVDLLYRTEGDPKKLKEMAQPSFWDKALDEALFQMRNGLLWLYPTHAINLTTNVFMMGARPLEKQVGSFLVSGGSAIRKQAAKEYYYTVASLTDGIKAASEAFLKGDSALAPHMSEWMETAGRNADHRPLNMRKVEDFSDVFHNIWEAGLWRTSTGLPTRALGAQDEFFKTIRYRAVVQARAMVQAEELGLKGADLKSFLEKRLADSFDAEGRAIDPAALREAQTVTFSQDLLPKTLGATLRNARNNHPTLGFLLPFVKTPVNVLRYAIKYTPVLNMAQKEYRHMISGKLGAEAQAQAYGQMALGSMFLGAATLLSMNGKITGGGPADEKLKRQLISQGWKPYSVKVDNEDGSTTYVPFGRFDPSGFVFGMGADLAEIYQVEGDSQAYTDAITAASVALAKNLSEKSFLLNLNQALEALTNPEDRMPAFLGNMAGSMVPASSALRGYVNQDPYQRDARTFLDNMKKNLPGFSSTLPPKRTPFGEPIWRQVGLTSTQDLDPVDEEHARIILETGFGLQNPSPNRGGVDFRDITLSNGRNAYDLYQEYASEPPSGPTLKESLAKVIKSEDYQLLADGDAATDGTKLAAISDVVSKYREAAFKRLISEFPELRQQVLQRKLDAAGTYLDNKSQRDGGGMTGQDLLKAIGL